MAPHSQHQQRPSSTTARPSLAPSSLKPRQLSHLHAQLATLTAHLADTENLVRMTAVQAGCIRDLGGVCGGMFMAASKVLGEEAAVMASELEEQEEQNRKKREKET